MTRWMVVQCCSHNGRTLYVGERNYGTFAGAVVDAAGWLANMAGAAYDVTVTVVEVGM